ncbi:hypothetical protein C8Q79DRAFT_1006548 [Trametes meyenii]|nr:hypothetical protein C8Q79DRAFT_1006548 [Trametes meyenii]
MQPNRQQQASPFTSPSAPPGAALQPSSDSDWSSQYNLGSPAPLSRTTTPAQSTGRLTPAPVVGLTHEQLDHIIKYISAVQSVAPSDSSSSSSTSAFLPVPSLPAVPTFNPGDRPASLSRPATPEGSRPKRIPRPPNAFMLYRSHLLKTGQIPRGVEHRQQNISRVAGECWNMLPDEEKRKWHNRAKDVLHEHMMKHPDYKFSPERKTPRRKAAQDPETPADGKKYIQFLREKYVGLIGEPPKPPRERSRKSRRGVEAHAFASRSLPPSLQSSPASSSSSARVISAPPSLSSSPAPPSAFQQPPPNFDINILRTYEVPFSSPSGSHVDPLQFAQHTAQPHAYGDDTTPKVGTFGDASYPQAKFVFPPPHGYHLGDPTAESHLGLQGLALPGSVTGVQQQGPSRPATPALPPSTSFDEMWVNIMQDPTGINPSGSHDDGAISPFAAADLSGPIDFSNIHFPALYPNPE